MKLWFSLIMALLITGCNSTGRKVSVLAYPFTKTVDSADIFFGVRVPDPYRWLENDTSGQTRSWIRQENRVTESYLSGIPYRDQIRKELKDQISYGRITSPDKEGDYYYFSKNTGLQNQSIIYRTRNPADTASARIFLDPNSFSDHGAVTLQETSFSTDGSLFAYSVSMGGSDWRDVLVKDTRAGKVIGDTLKNMKFSGISFRGNKGYYYSTYNVPKGQNRLIYKTVHHILYYHQLGTPQARDQFIFGGDKEPNRYISGYVTQDGHYLVISASETTTGNELFIQDLTRKNAPIIPVVKGYASEQDVIDNEGSTLFIYTNLDAPNYRLVKVDASDPGPENWKDVIPETGNVLQVSSGGGYFYAQYIVNVKNQVFQYDYQGRLIREIKLPAAGTATGFSAYRHQKSLYYTFTSFTYPSTIYHFTMKVGRSTLYWKPTLKFNPGDFITRQVFYPSKDGTRIPMYIVYRKGLSMNGKNPTYLYGYGGFNISLMPEFSSLRMEWLEHGGIYAQPNLRGGGEYGQKWHLAGTRLHKQNVFDDFIGAAQYLIREKYTSPHYLAIAGASNGGLLVGATMTQRPDLMQVALPSVGVLDMLRYNKFTAGAGWASDYGTAEESPAMFRYLLGYSPLQHVKMGVHYPATLVWTADHDDRVVPGHSFKFAATLQADQTGDNPVLIQIQHNAGHGTGMDTQKEIDYIADQYAFAWYNMGIRSLK